MPIETVKDDQNPFVTQVVTVALVVEEVIDGMKRLYLDPDHEPSTPVLWDARQNDPTSTGFSELFAMVDNSTEFWNKMSGGKTAILVAKHDHLPQARLYQSLAKAMPRELDVFDDYDEAVNWLTQPSQSDSTSAAAPNAS